MYLEPSGFSDDNGRNLGGLTGSDDIIRNMLDRFAHITIHIRLEAER